MQFLLTEDITSGIVAVNSAQRIIHQENASVVADDVHQTHKIANVRILAERVISIVRRHRST